VSPYPGIDTRSSEPAPRRREQRDTIIVIEEDVMTTERLTGPTVADAMTVSPVVIAESEAIAAVAELLAGYEISGLPVVDSDDQLVGVISQTDLIRLQGASVPWSGWHGLIVRDLMSRPAQTIDQRASLNEAARRMTVAAVHRLVVVDETLSPVGIISESDLVREIADACDDC
jgi:CBS domain-containing protein